MTQIVSLSITLKTGCAYLRDPRNLREIITPARKQSLTDVCFFSLADYTDDADCLILFFGPRGPRFFLDEKGGPVGFMVSALDCSELARKQAGR